jgi:hypothetical protein
VGVDGCEQFGPVSGLADHSHRTTGLEDRAQPGEHQWLVVGEHHTDGGPPLRRVDRHVAESNRSAPVIPNAAQRLRGRFSRTRTEIRTGDPVNPNSSRSRRSRNRR